MAFSHARSLWAWERSAGLPDELNVQNWLLAHPSLAHAANSYYASVHFPFAAAVLVWPYLRRRNVYRWTRNVLILITAGGLALAFAFPLAPPRMMTDLGFTDVAAAFGQSVYSRPGSDAANQFAAMPSLHIGWAILVAVALIAAGRHRFGTASLRARRRSSPPGQH